MDNIENLKRLNGSSSHYKLSRSNAMPLISDKIYLRLEYLMGDGNDISSENPLLVSAILNELRILGECLEREEQNFAKDQLMLYISEIEIAKSITYSLYKEFKENIVYTLRPLDIEEVLHLIGENDVATSCIRGKDIIMLLSKTGSGKSSTIQYLAGSKMKYQNEDRKDVVVDEYNPAIEQLPSITIGITGNSTTRFVSAVKVSTGGGYGGQDIWLCDSAGVDDTSGAEVDIANSLGFTDAINACRSVRFLILFSFEGGNRFEEVVDVTKTISKMVPSDKMREFLYYVQFGLTKGKHLQTFIDKLATVDKNRIVSQAHGMLIDKLLAKCKKGEVALIDLMDETGAEQLLDSLIDIRPFEHPVDTFIRFLPDQSRQKVNAQIEKIKTSIHTFFHLQDFDALALKLNHLQALVETIIGRDDKSIVMEYDHAIATISQLIVNKQRTVVNALELGMDDFNTLSIDAIKYYKSTIEMIQLAIQKLKPKHNFKALELNLADMFQTIVRQFTSNIQVMQQASFLDITHSNKLNKLRALCSVLNDIIPSTVPNFKSISEMYESTCSYGEKLIDDNFKACEICIEPHDWKLFHVRISDLKKQLAVLNDHISPVYTHQDRVNILINKFYDYSNLYLKERSDYVDWFGNPSRNIPMVECKSRLMESLDYFNSLSSSHEYLSDIVKTDWISEWSSKVVDRIQIQIVGLIGTADKARMLSDYDRVCELLDDINVLRELPGMDSKTADAFYSFEKDLYLSVELLLKTADTLINLFFTNDNQYFNKENLNLSSKEIDVEDIKLNLSTMNNSRYDARDMQKLNSCVVSIRSARASLERLRPGSFTEEFLTKVQNTISTHVRNNKAKIDLNRLNDINCGESQIRVVNGIMRDMFDLSPLDDIIAEVVEHRNLIQETVKQKLSDAFGFILNLNVRLDESSDLIFSFSNAESALKFLQFFSNGNSCSDSIVKLVGDQAEMAAEHVRLLIANYRELIIGQYLSSYETLRTFDDDGESRFGLAVRKYLHICSQIKSIHDDYPLLSRALNSQSVLHDLCSKRLVDLANYFNDELQSKLWTKQNLQFLLMRVSLLKRADCYMPESSENFTKLFGTYWSESLKVTTNSKGQICDEIYNKNFGKVVVLFNTLKRNNFLQDADVDEIINQLRHVLSDEIDEIASRIHKMSRNVDKWSEDVDLIVKKLDNVKHLTPLEKEKIIVFSEPSPSNFIQETKKQLRRKIMESLRYVAELQNAAQFYRADIMLNHIEEAVQAMGKYVADTADTGSFGNVGTLDFNQSGSSQMSVSIQESINQLQNGLQNILDQVVNNYINMEFTQYRQDPPIAMYKRFFGEYEIKKSDYNAAWNRLVNEIDRKFRNEFSDISKLEPFRSAVRERLGIVNDAINFAPESLQPSLRRSLAEFKENREIELDQEKEAFGAIDYLMPSLLLARYNTHTNDKDLRPAITRTIRNNMNRLHTDFYASFANSNNFNEYAELIVAMLEYEKLFKNKSVFHEINQFAKCRNDLVMKFEAMFKILHDLDSKENTDALMSSFELLSTTLDFYFTLDHDTIADTTSDQVTSVQSEVDSVDKVPNLIVLKKSVFSVILRTFIDQAKATLIDLGNQVRESDRKFQNFLSSITTNIDCPLRSSNSDDWQTSKGFDQLLLKLRSWSASQASNLKSFLEESENGVVQAIVEWNSLSSKKSKLQQEFDSTVKNLEKIKFLTVENNANHKARFNFYKSLEQDLVRTLEVRSCIKELSGGVDELQSKEAKVWNVITSQLASISSILDEEKQRVLEATKDCSLTESSIALDHLICFIEAWGESNPAFVEKNVKPKIDLFINFLHQCNKDCMDILAKTNNDKLDEISAIIMKIQVKINNFESLPPKFGSSLLTNYFDTLISRADGKKMINRLGVLMENDQNGVGQTVISAYPCFQGYAVSIFNRLTKAQDEAYVLEHLESQLSEEELVSLKSRYTEFNGIYEQYFSHHLKSIVDFDKIVEEIQRLVDFRRNGTQPLRDLPKLLAMVFATWTLQSAADYFSMGADYMKKPHPVQVIGILLMLDNTPRKNLSLANNLAQISTGEGKSVVLGICCCVLALHGYKVDCACYSELLSERDYCDFKGLFTLLRVDHMITYGTFNQLCEGKINSHGLIRDLVSSRICNTGIVPVPISESESISGATKSVLLIDEVDVFFKEDFYGELYNPMVKIVHTVISEMTDWIWAKRSERSILAKIQLECPAYNRFIELFPQHLFKETLKDMISHMQTFDSISYVVKENKIGYKDQDGISFNIVYGYRTLFAYYHEHSKGKISKESLDAYKSINLNCGHFSYAELPKEYTHIIGVSGTVEVLNKSEKKILSEFYNINRTIILPSAYGTKNLDYHPESDISIIAEKDFNNHLHQFILSKIERENQPNSRRAILVVFESMDDLQLFFNAPCCKPERKSFNLLTEELSVIEKKKAIHHASWAGKITLMTRVFGRGVDFYCNDTEVLQNGGVLVIQTFLSEKLSEQIQIQGRTARQGQRGAYRMILKREALDKFLLNDTILYKTIAERTLMSYLNGKRVEYYNMHNRTSHERVTASKNSHDESMKFIEAVINNNVTEIFNYLVKENCGGGAVVNGTMIIMDATGSMANLLNSAKLMITVTFTRTFDILKKNNLPASSIKLKLAVYRNYNSDVTKLLETSGWENNPTNLSSFLNGIKAEDGLNGGEAMEVALREAANEIEFGRLSQVLVLGDAPANTQYETMLKRQLYHDRWAKSEKFSAPCFWDLEVNRLAIAGVPVHTFYLQDNNSSLKKSFKDIAKRTAGTSQYLDVNSAEGTDILTNKVTEALLADIGRKNNLGDKLVADYREKFVKGHLK
eukprot:gene10639-14288_t